jgi:hypothetical protein
VKSFKLILSLGVLLISGTKFSAVFAKELDIDRLCTKFPLNSRCLNNNNSKARAINSSRHQLDRDRFCQDFPLNSNCQVEPLQVIKFNLDRSGENNEWIRIERKDNTLRVLHTSQVKDGLVSEVLNGALSFVPSPILPEVNKYNWEDHRVTRVSFKSDRCKDNSCVITGKKSLNISKKTNIHQGMLTIQYQEKDLIRGISFKIPPDADTSISKKITITTPK